MLRHVFLLSCLVWTSVVPGFAAVFGSVVEIGGHAADVALDERRGVVYVANFAANRVEVISTADLSIKSSMAVSAQPGSLALSPDARYLVVTHYGGSEYPFASANGVTILDLDANSKRSLATASIPLAAAFGSDGKAVVITSLGAQLLEPASGVMTMLAPASDLGGEKLPVTVPKFPAEIVKASANSSPDGKFIYAIAQLGGSDAQVFSLYYDVVANNAVVHAYTTSPNLGPRAVSVSEDGSYATLGWGLVNRRGILLAQFNNPLGRFDIGSSAIDSRKGVIYAQMAEAPKTTTTTPATPTTGTGTGTTPPPAPVDTTPTVAMLMVVDSDNLALRETYYLPENLVGKSVLSRDGSMLYAASQSGLTVLPVGQIDSMHRVVASEENLLFRGNFCDRRSQSRDIDIVNPGGGNTPFSLSVKSAGVSVSPESGVTPARVTVTVDPGAFQNNKGTTEVFIELRSGRAVNVPPPVRVLLNNREPDQKGSFFNVPGKLVDVLADPFRNRFYVLRQDKNLVLVFDGTSYQQIGTLRTGNTPWQMAITQDGKNLIVGNDNSQIANVYDLDTLAQTQFIEFPGGHYPRSIAVSGNAILAACRVAGPKHTIDRVDVGARRAVELPTLGIWENKISVDTALSASPSGGTIFVAQPEGAVMVYNAGTGTFTAARKDLSALSGSAGALSDDRFLVDTNVLNRSLVLVSQLDKKLGSTSGAAAVDGVGLRTAAASAASPGVIERVQLSAGVPLRAVRVSEAPPVYTKEAGGRAFLRTLTPLSNRNGIVSLTTSGFTVLAWDYDAAVGNPTIDRVVNAADETTALAPGGLIKVIGSSLSPVNVSTSELPLQGLLGDTCLTVNGVPVPVSRVSPSELLGQLPFGVVGGGVMVLKSPGGVSNEFALTITPVAPSVFRATLPGQPDRFATIVRASNNSLVTFSNPIHPEDHLVIYLTGMGRTDPAVEAGYPGPSSPPSSALVAPTVTLGGVGVPVDFAGLTPGEVGVYQINARVPWWAPIGMSVPLEISQGGQSTAFDVRVVK